MADQGSLEYHPSALSAPFILMIVVAFQFVTKYLKLTKKNATKTEKEIQLRAEIKNLLKEASSLTQPSTFAQAAKLRRRAATKEKELSNYHDVHGKEMNKSYDVYLKAIFISKVFTFAVLILWYWKAPVAVVSQQLVQPFGKLLSWRSGGVQNDMVMVGVIPWLMVSTRVSKFVNRLLH
ncbi:hypothetical protein L6164_027540 [Bauhinia variegata]|uniref:Uncharacterized protein n=1 Tax=Bauhinia variegata TaxID=167791 RepID=A0ACB9LUI0_BAUVA|nr:hypothetical protein L6164_027540 [Bauhinia variegata]